MTTLQRIRRPVRMLRRMDITCSVCGTAASSCGGKYKDNLCSQCRKEMKRPPPTEERLGPYRLVRVEENGVQVVKTIYTGRKWGEG